MEAKLEKVFENVLRTDAVVEVFVGLISLAPEDHEKRIKTSLCHFQDLIKDLPREDAYVKGYTSTLVSYYHKQKHIRRINFMADVVRVCIKEMIVPTKPALECLLANELLKPTERLHWCKTFAIVKEFIHLSDYKGCRDILRMIFNRIKPISAKSWVTMQDQMNSVVELVEYILDSEACLLPGYLAVNEVRLYVGEDQSMGHWSLSNRVAEFVDRFRAIASMVSLTGRGDLLPIFNHFSPSLASTWRIDPETLRFVALMKIQLPYDRSFYQSQTKLLRYILAQPYSRDMVFHVLGIQKQQKQPCKQLESELVELIIYTMEQSNTEDNFDESDDVYPTNKLQWQHLASQMIYFIIFEFISFPKMVESLHQKLAQRNITKGREHLLWVLLQYVSGSIQKNPVADFIPIVKLVHLLYPEKVPLPEPDITKPLSMHQYAAICILMHLNKKFHSELQQRQEGASNTSGSNSSLLKGYQYCHIPIPVSLQTHYEYLRGCLEQQNANLEGYARSLICNACSTTTDIFNGPLVQFVNCIDGDVSDTIAMPGKNCVAFGKTVPLSMSLLDSLTVHTKMSIIQHIVHIVLELAQSQNRPNIIALSPAFVETYSRLLVYMEAETHGIKGLLSQVFPKVLQNNSLVILNMLLELCSYRLHHIQPQYRIQLLTNLHKLASSPNMDHNQLQVGVESTALRMIMALLNADVKAQLTRVTTNNDPKLIISKDSEEFNRVLVLTIARSLRITGGIHGAWCTDILKAIMEATPHTWAMHTLKCFPRNLQEFYMSVNVKVTNKETLKSNVEAEYCKWANILGRNPNRPVDQSMEQEAINQFTMVNSPPLFLCLLWKVLASGLELAPVCYSIVTAIGRRRLSAHVRMFSDFLVHEFSLDGGSHAKRFIPIIYDMIVKYNLVFLDQLILCLGLRCNEGDQAQVALFIIQYLLLKPEDFRGCVLYFVQETKSADHWTVDDWHSKHMNYHNKYPEKFFFEGLKDAVSDGDVGLKSDENAQQYLPVYFGNLPLRLLPVFDIVIHRSLELLQMTNSVTSSLETLLTHVAPLYKFHPQPITFLFNTLHYYEKQLRELHQLKKVLVTAIIGSLNDSKPPNWALSGQYLEYSRRTNLMWEPRNDYYCHLVKRVVDTMLDKRPTPFPPHDWRFNEFPNASAYALNVTCVELMAVPVSPESVGMALMDVVLKTQSIIDRKEFISWINAVALILITLPEVYWKPLYSKLIDVLSSPALTSSPQDMTSYPYHLMKFSDEHFSYSDQSCTRLLQLAHATWHQMGLGHLSMVPQILKEKFKPKVTTELQLLYVCHLIAPFLPRFQQERTRCMLDIVGVIYDMLQKVSSTSKVIRFMDEIADFLYHIKYIHVGDAIKDQVEEIIEGLQPGLRKRLRFIYTTTAKSHF